MERVIRIDLNSREDLLEKYNNSVVSNELINYIINQAMLFSKKEDFNIIINENCNIEEDFVLLIREGLKTEYKKSLKKHYLNNIIEIFLIIIGIIFLSISRMIGNNIFNEVFLIIGSVPIWEAIELELFSDNEERRKRYVLKKLLISDFIIDEN